MTQKIKKQIASGAPRKRGRKKGGKNKLTVLRETKQAEVVAKLIDSGKPLAVTVLQKAMEFAESAVATFRPTLSTEVAQGVAVNKDGNVEEFGKWFDRWVKTIETLAKYQSPQIKAMDAPTPPPAPGENKKRFTLRVFEGGRPPLQPPPANDEDAA